jgi:hypothetical protein
MQEVKKKNLNKTKGPKIPRKNNKIIIYKPNIEILF